MPGKPANMQLVDHRTFQAWYDRRFCGQKLATTRDYSPNGIVSTVRASNCLLANPSCVRHRSGPRIHEFFPSIYAPRVTRTGGQAFDKNVPEEIAPICFWIENDDLKWFSAVCSFIK